MKITWMSPAAWQLSTLVSSAAVVALGISVAGCALFNPEAVERHKAGWKAGWVKSVGSADELGAQLDHDCRVVSASAGQVFALINYPHGRTFRSAIGVVPQNVPLAEGQEVWVPTRDCRPIEAK